MVGHVNYNLPPMFSIHIMAWALRWIFRCNAFTNKLNELGASVRSPFTLINYVKVSKMVNLTIPIISSGVLKKKKIKDVKKEARGDSWSKIESHMLYNLNSYIMICCPTFHLSLPKKKIVNLMHILPTSLIN